MGYQDRDWYRDRSGGRASLGLGWSVNTWLIVLCVLVFAADPFLRGVFARWLGADVQRPLTELGYFSTSTALFGQTDQGNGFPQFWRFLTFQFLHLDFDHLAFNMIGLYFFGPVVEQYLGGKRYLAFYLFCGVCGALMYMLLNLAGLLAIRMHMPQLPMALLYDPRVPLVGASAGIFAMIMGAAFLAPNSIVYAFFVIPMRLRNFAWLMIGIAVFTVLNRGHNAGGEAAHLGGAIAGYFLIRRPHLLHALFDWLSLFDPTSRTRRVRAAQRRGAVASGEIDRILEKIRQRGLHSLTDAERQTLREASRR
jgi:membrane associated rhomboid family serine protease